MLRSSIIKKATAESSSSITEVRLILVEDHALVRAGIASLIRGLPGISIVAETGDGRHALRLTETYQPDLVLMDISLPGMDGLECCAHITQHWPQIKVLMLSMHNTQGFVDKALRSGAVGYMVKDAAEAELEIAIRALVQGKRFLSPAIAHHVLEGYLRKDSAPASPLDKLTARQREVLVKIARGFNTKQIASSLKISTKTVETHRALLMDRLNIHDIAGLTRLALQYRLIEPDSQQTIFDEKAAD